MKIKALLTQRVEAAFNDVGIQAPALVQLSNRPEFGDYQANGVMAAAKKRAKTRVNWRKLWSSTWTYLISRQM